MHFAAYATAAVGAYLLGSIPTGFLVGKARGVDIRQSGSGNIGATNVFRILGKKAGALVLFGDAFKGFAACRWLPSLAAWVGQGPAGVGGASLEPLAVFAGLFAFLGHVFTIWLRFRGGKGIATSAGILAALAPGSCLMVVGLWSATLVLTRYVSVASMVAAVGLPFIAWMAGAGRYLLALVSALSVLALYKHRSNFRRLLNGTENRFQWNKKTPPTTS